MLTHFSVKNYKCLADVSLPLTPIHVIIGENDTGKTSLFEAIEAAVQISNTDSTRHDNFSNTFPGKLFSELVTNQLLAGMIQFKLTMDLKGATNATKSIEISFSEQSGKRSDNTPLKQSVQTFRFRPRLMAKPSASRNPPVFKLDTDGFGLSTLLDEITGYDVNQFVELQAAFIKYFPKYHRIKLTPTNAYVRSSYQDNDQFGEAIGKEVRFSTSMGDLKLSQTSDGVILLLGFLALTYSPDPPKIILIEEPENGIHPKRLQEVARLLRQFTQQEKNAPQIIMTTHSPWLLSEFQPEEVTLMRRQPDGSAKAFPLRDAKHIRERMGSEFDLGELWYNLTEEDLLK